MSLATQIMDSMKEAMRAKDTVAQVTAKLKADGVKIQQLTTSHAFHSPLMNGVIEPFKDFLSNIQMLKPSIPIISNLTGEIADTEMSSVDYWCKQILNPVLFMADIQALASTGCKNIIEIGRTSFRNFSNPITHGYWFNFGCALIPSNRVLFIISQWNRNINRF